MQSRYFIHFDAAKLRNCRDDSTYCKPICLRRHKNTWNIHRTARVAEVFQSVEISDNWFFSIISVKLSRWILFIYSFLSLGDWWLTQMYRIMTIIWVFIASLSNIRLQMTRKWKILLRHLLCVLRIFGSSISCTLSCNTCHFRFSPYFLESFFGWSICTRKGMRVSNALELKCIPTQHCVVISSIIYLMLIDLSCFLNEIARSVLRQKALNVHKTRNRWHRKNQPHSFIGTRHRQIHSRN